MTEPGWYPDPNHHNVLRWHTGDHWTDEIRPTQGSADPEPPWQQTAQAQVVTSMKWMVMLGTLGFLALVVGGLVLMVFFYEGRNDFEEAARMLAA